MTNASYVIQEQTKLEKPHNGSIRPGMGYGAMKHSQIMINDSKVSFKFDMSKTVMTSITID